MPWKINMNEFKKNNPEQEKLEMPQLNPATEISNDYRNEFTSFFSLFSMDDKQQVLDILKQLNEVRIKKYEELYSSKIYKNIITPKNKDSIEKLNKLVDQINEKLLKFEATDYEDFKEDFMKMYKESELLIRGVN